MDKWDACAFPVKEEELIGRTYYGGLDLSSTSDITAFMLVFPPRNDEEKYIILPYCWIPEDNMRLRVRRDHVPFGQGYKDMSPSTKELMKLTLEERIAHCGHKVLRWRMDNVYVRQDPAGNIKMDKEKSTEKIDAAEATVMALDRAIRNEGSDRSVYDDRGIIVF